MIKKTATWIEICMKWFCSNTHAAIVHNKIQYQTVFTFTCCAWRTTLDNRNILFQDSMQVQSVGSRFLSSLTFWFYCSLLSKTRHMNKCIIGVIYLGGWVKHAVYSWLYHSFSAPVSDRRGSTSCNEKTKHWNNLIGFTRTSQTAITI